MERRTSIEKISNKIEIYQNSVLVKTVSLSENILIPLQHCIIEIKDGKARIKESDCKKQICVKQGWSSTFPIVCVPNEILIRFPSDNEEIIITK
jgi:hypothetical protein